MRLIQTLGMLISATALAVVQIQGESNKQVARKESAFLTNFSLSIPLGVGTLIEECLGNNAKSVYAGGTENVIEQSDLVFVTRRFDAEVELKRVDIHFQDKLKTTLENRLRTNGLVINKTESHPSGFNIDYTSRCTVGSVDVRILNIAILTPRLHRTVRGNLYNIFFVFHESSCKQ